MLLVIAPNKEIQTANLKSNLYGFVVVDSGHYSLGPSKEAQAVRRHSASIRHQVLNVFSDLIIKGKVDCVVDAILSPNSALPPTASVRERDCRGRQVIGLMRLSASLRSGIAP